MSLAGRKAAARQAAAQVRRAAHAAAAPGQAGKLSECLAGHRGVAVSGYWPIRTEIDPRPALAEAAAYGPVGLPVVVGPGQPLIFRAWTPGAAMVAGVYGAEVPEADTRVVPQIVILPLLAFDRNGARLGYGGGFYDRTLAELRATGPVLALGFGFAAQEVPAVPVGDTDARLDAIVTEHEVINL